MTRHTSFKGTELALKGNEIKAGDKLPAFTLTGNDMGDLKSQDFAGKKLLVSVVPSLDTPVCAIQTKRFNEELSKLGSDVAVLTVSMDLPFAQKRWCGAEGVERVVTASDYKYRTFGEAVGTFMPAWGLLSRAVFVADKTGKIVYSEYVPEVSAEPNYEAAISAVKSLG